MSTNMSPTSPTLEAQLVSIMDVLVKAAVAEISQLFSESSEALHLQITQSLNENEALRMRTKVMRSELFSLRLQTRMRASRPASRFSLARPNIPTPRTTSQVVVETPVAQKHPSYITVPSENETSSADTKEKCAEDPDVILIQDEDDVEGCSPVEGNRDDFRNSSALVGVAAGTPNSEAPGSSCMSCDDTELRIVSVHGRGEGPLVEDNVILFTATELQAPSSLSPDPTVSHGVTFTSGANERPPERPPKRRKQNNGVGLGRDHCTKTVSPSLSPVLCTVCGKSFVNRTTLTTHMRLHTGEKPYICSLCGKRFAHHGSLKIHLRTHSGEKPYSCSQCSASFNNPSNLRRHMVIHS